MSSSLFLLMVLYPTPADATFVVSSIGAEEFHSRSKHIDIMSYRNRALLPYPALESESLLLCSRVSVAVDHRFLNSLLCPCKTRVRTRRRPSFNMV